MNGKLTFKIALTGILSALATLAFMIENLFPPLFLPGARMGVSNAFILLAVLILGGRYGFFVLTVKCLLGSLFSGNISAIIYSLPSGAIALAVEVLLLYLVKNLSVVAISVCGAVINASLQNVVFCLVSGTGEYLFYTPYLALISMVSGVIIGLAVLFTVKKFPSLLIENK